MQVFNVFFKITKKNLNISLIYFSIYAMITVLLTITGKDTYTNQFQASSLPIAIADEDHSACSRALYNYLASLHDVSDLTADDEAVFDQMYYRTLDYALTIPAGFEEKLYSGETKSLVSSLQIPGGVRGYYVDQQVTQYLKTLQLYLAAGCSIEEAIEKTDAAITELPAPKTISFEPENQAAADGVFYYFQYLPYIFIVSLFSGMAPTLINLNRPAVRNRTACSSLPAGWRNGQLALSCILYSLILWLALLLPCQLMYGTDMFRPNALLCILNSFVFLLFSTATTLFISCFPLDGNTLNMFSNIVGLSMAFLCGIFVPQQMLSDTVLSVAKFLPAYWYIRINNMLGGFGTEIFSMDTYVLCIEIQLLFALAMFAVTFVALRQKRLSH